MTSSYSKLKKAIIVVWCPLLVFGSAFARKGDTLRLYYRINESAAYRQMLKLDSLCVADAGHIRSVKIKGYADFTGTKAYNKQLSLKRAVNVKAYLLKRYGAITVSCFGNGAVPGNAVTGVNGMPANRKVEVIVIKDDPVNNNRPITMARIDLKDTLTATTLNAEQKINQLPALQVGESIDIDDFLFEPGRHYLLPGSEKYITELYNVLKNNKDLKIELIGHICCEYATKDAYDNDTRSFTLSLNRAKFLYVTLLRMGINEARMKYAGLGSTKPKVYPEITENDRIANRRVEILILGN